MKTSEILKIAADQSGITKTQMTAGFRAAMETIIKTVQDGTPVSIKGLGRFSLSKPRADGSTRIIFKAVAPTKGDA
jgi:nucleoid DNA-binding protein